MVMGPLELPVIGPPVARLPWWWDWAVCDLDAQRSIRQMDAQEMTEHRIRTSITVDGYCDACSCGWRIEYTLDDRTTKTPEPVRHGGHAAKYRERLPVAVEYLLFGVGRIAFDEFTKVGRHTEDEPVPFVRRQQPARVPRERPFMALDRVGHGGEQGFGTIVTRPLRSNACEWRRLERQVLLVECTPLL
jgi:hypothetical protein